MGGLLFLSVLILLAILAHADRDILVLVGLGLGCGCVGVLDDILSIRRSTNRGLRARTKFLLTALVAVVFLYVVSTTPSWPTRDLDWFFVPFFGKLSVPYWLWLAVSLVVIVATTHAVNLTDGLDGLAAGSILPPLGALIWIGFGFTSPQIFHTANAVTVVDLVIAGALVGFLYYNRFPAKLIMGDTGSLALGGILAGSAIMLGMQLMLIVIGGVFVAETLSVILQVASFKMTGKRIFRMSPLHHHFELAGWPETKVTHRFWAASALCSLLGVALLRFGVVR